MGLDVTLLRPLWLLALPVLAVLGWALWRRRATLGDWRHAADPGLLQAMARLGHVDAMTGGVRGLVLLLASMGLAIIALSGPAIERRDALSFRNLDGVLFVVDVSDSVTEHPRWPEMMATGRFAIAGLGTRPGGVIAFAGDAYMVADMTHDHFQVGQTFSLLKAGVTPDRGSRPARGLTLAADRLESAEVIAGDVLLLTDGDQLDPASLAAAERIAALGSRLSVVSIDAPTPSMEGHAGIGGGQVFAVDDVDAISALLGEDVRTRLERQEFPLLYWRDFGRYILFLALIPLAFMFQRQAQ